jgi:rhamnosyltransferase
MKMSKVSFILPTRNVEKYIGPLLDAIFSQEYDGDIEVLIMDSSDDRTPEIVKEFPIRFVRVEPEDYNYGKTRNEGAALTDGDFLVFLSTDVEIRDKKWLLKLTRHFSDPEVAGVYGRQLPKEDAQPMEQFFILHTYPPESDLISLKGGKLRKGFFFSNVNSAIRRSVWEQIKIPEMLKAEDHEWAKRALLAGYKIVYDSDAAVYHSHKYSLKKVFREYFDSGAARPILYQGINYSLNSFFTDGLKFISEEYKFMLKNGYGHWIPYAIFYDITKFLGFFLGSKQKYMPIWMKKLLCRKKNHWDKYNDVIKEGT